MSKTVETGRRKFIRDAGKTANENLDAVRNFNGFAFLFWLLSAI